MELNRRGVERSLQIAHLEGKVQLTNLPPSRQRSAEAQGEELAAKRFLFFGERKQKAEEENPYKRVVSVPEGWRIEINDQRITDELTEKKLSGKELQRTFINRFNGQLREGLKECVWREKFSSEKDRLFTLKAAQSIGYSITTAVGWIPLALSNLPYAVGFYLGSELMGFCILNNLSKARKIDHTLEIFMPPVEIDKVARTYGYLAGKGRRLVREVGEKDKL